MRWAFVTIVTAVASMMLVSGCGGGNGLIIPVPDRVVRQLKVGDYWVYRVNGTFYDPNTNETAKVSEQVRVDVSGYLQDQEGRNYLVLQHDVTPQANSKTKGYYAGGFYLYRFGYTGGFFVYYSRWRDGFFVYRQDQNGNIYARGVKPDTGDIVWNVEANPEVLILRSPLQIGQTYNYNIALSDGTQVSSNYSVNGVERVTVPAGTFTAFKVISKGSFKSRKITPEGTREFTAEGTATEWFVPSIGTSVKAIVAITSNSNASLNLTLELDSYHLASP